MYDFGSALRSALDDEGLLTCPGVHDPLTAIVAEKVGFGALYLTGYGASLSTGGYPDAGLLTLSEMAETATRVQERVSIPVIADADTGYGNATNVVRTVREYVRAGVGAVQLEDQTTPKRCGHLKGKRVISQTEAVGKIRAAVDTRADLDGDLLIVARSDARGAVGGSLDDAITRVNAYCEAGADLAFVEGQHDREEVKRVGKAVDFPLVYNSPGASGTSPSVEASTLDAWGYDVVLYPLASTLATIVGTYRTLRGVAEEGQETLRDLDREFEGLDIGSIHAFAGFPEIAAQERRYMPTEEAAKYDESTGIDPEE